MRGPPWGGGRPPGFRPSPRRSARATGPRSAFSASSGPASASRPSCRIATWSAIPSIACRSWVVTKTVVPRSARSPMTSWKTASRATTSRPSVGSSSSSSSGAWPSASASMTAPFWPFESRPKARSAGTSKRRNRSATAGGVPARVEPGAEGRERERRHLRWRVRLLRHDADPGHEARAVPPRVLAEEADAALRRGPLAEEHAEERGLAGAVAAEQGEDRAAGHAQGQPLDHARAAVAHREPVHLEGRARGGGHGVVSALIACLPSPSARRPARPTAAPRRPPPAPRPGSRRAWPGAWPPPAARRALSAAGIAGGRSATNVPSPRRVSRIPASTRRW